jgi:hypothetical protein
MHTRSTRNMPSWRPGWQIWQSQWHNFSTNVSTKYSPDLSANHLLTALRSFSDPFVSLHQGQGAFMGNRSFALHFANKTRIACANFTSISNAQGPGMIGFNSSGNPLTTLVPFHNGTNAAATFTSGAPGATIAPERVASNSGSQTRALSSILLLSSVAAGLWSCL